MISNLIQKYHARRIRREFMLLELDELAAHANAEASVVKAQRALEDAEKRQQRDKDDAQMDRRWETKRLEIEKKYLTSTSETLEVEYPMPKVVPITKEQ